MTRIEMMDNLIKRIGMEHPYVIGFCRLCETTPENEWNDSMLYGMYMGAIDHNWEEE